MHTRIDRPFLIITTILIIAGFFIFSSASLGLLARENIRFSAVAVNQLVSLILGVVALFIASRLHHRLWNRYALYIFLFSVGATLLVFIPGLGFSHNGASRWIAIAGFTFQPAEFLKLGFIIYWASWITGVKHKITTFKHGLLPLVVLLGIVGGILILQPDMGTFLVIALTGLIMFLAAGGRWTHILSLGAVAAGGLLSLSFFVPYIRGRLLTFINPAADPLGAGYQIQQSLIAIGSGGWFGRGFGQSIQKFNFLPEPIGDSIFAVFAEEWGIAGGAVLVILFLFFALRGLKIAARAPSLFSRLITVGIISFIAVQSFINIGAMLGISPLTGIPLIFVSQGGSALLVALAAVGIVFNISKYQRRV